MGSHYAMLRGSDSAGSSSGSCQHEMRSVLLPYTGWHPRIHSTQTKHQVHTYVRTYSVRNSCSFIHSALSLASEDVGSVLVRVLTLSLQLPSPCPIAILACRETRQGVGPMHERSDHDLNLAHHLQANMSTLATLMAAILTSIANHVNILLPRVT